MSGFISSLKKEWISRHPATLETFKGAVDQALQTQKVDTPHLETTHLFLNRIVIPGLEKRPISKDANHYIKALSRQNDLALLSSSQTLFQKADLDGDRSLTPIEIALCTYAVQDNLQQMVKPLSEHSIGLFIRNLSISGLQASRDTGNSLPASQAERLPAVVEKILESDAPFNESELVLSAKNLLNSLQSRLKSEPQNRDLWLASFRVWEVLLELSKTKHPENYLALMGEYAAYYELKNYASATNTSSSQPPYLLLFHYFSHLQWVSVCLFDFELQKKIHTHSLTPEDGLSMFHLFSQRVYDIHQLAKLKVEGMRSHEFFIKHLGYSPGFLSEEVLTSQSCPHQEGLSLGQKEDAPYNVVESFEKWCRCFCPPLFGQDSTAYSNAMLFSNHPKIKAWLQPHWERLMNNPNAFEEIWKEIRDHVAYFQNHPLELYSSIKTNPIAQGLALIYHSQTQVPPKDWEPAIAALRGKGVSIYAHRVGDSEVKRDQAQERNYGFEVDVSYTADGKWVLYHEYQTRSGVHVVDLSSEQLKKEGVPLLETLRTEDHPLIIDDKAHNHHPRTNFQGAARSLIASLGPVGNNILIDSIDPNFLADLKREIVAHDLHYQLAYLFMEYGILKEFADQANISKWPDPPFDTLMVYGKDLRRLQKENPAALQILNNDFKIIIAEDDPRTLEGLPFNGLIAAGLPGIGPGGE